MKKKAVKKVLIVISVIAGAAIVGVLGISAFAKAVFKDEINPPVNMIVTSPAFSEGGKMPVKYTGKGENLSPPLELESLAEGAKTIAVTMDDLDFPMGIFNHWVIWNIPALSTHIPEGIAKGEIVSTLGNAIQGKSQYGGKHYYRGPLPPFGTHRYVFKVYVLDTELDLDKNCGKHDLQKAMEGHILQFGTLTGIFGEG